MSQRKFNAPILSGTVVSTRMPMVSNIPPAINPYPSRSSKQNPPELEDNDMNEDYDMENNEINNTRNQPLLNNYHLNQPGNTDFLNNTINQRNKVNYNNIRPTQNRKNLNIDQNTENDMIFNGDKRLNVFNNQRICVGEVNICRNTFLNEFINNLQYNQQILIRTQFVNGIKQQTKFCQCNDDNCDPNCKLSPKCLCDNKRQFPGKNNIQRLCFQQKNHYTCVVQGQACCQHYSFQHAPAMIRHLRMEHKPQFEQIIAYAQQSQPFKKVKTNDHEKNLNIKDNDWMKRRFEYIKDNEKNLNMNLLSQTDINECIQK